MNNRLTRKVLTKETIVHMAIKIADTKGIEALSMRQLGQQLGVEAMALYHHFKSKNELTEAMLDAVHAEIITPDVNNWREAMYSRAISVLEAIEHHPWAADIMESGVQPGPATMQDREAMARCFRKAGFSVEATVHAITFLDIYVYGAAQQYVHLTISTAEQAAQVSQEVTKLFPAAYPYFSELLETYISAGKYNPKDEFHFGLTRVLDSIAAL